MDKIPFLSLQHQHQMVREEVMNAIQSVYDNNRFILGHQLDEFEKGYAAFIGTKYSAGVGNGLDALVMSLKALNVGVDDEVIVPSHTFIATWLAPVLVGASIVPVEPDEATFNIDAAKIQAAITKKTKAIIPVHLFGQPCEMDALMKIARDHKLYVIEDNAQAHSAACNGKMTGSFGDINAHSFYPIKNLGAIGDGGAITTNSEELYRSALMLRNYGFAEKSVADNIGGNSRLDEVHAAVLRVKLKYIDQWTKERQMIADQYLKELAGLNEIRLPSTAKGCKHVYHLFVIRTQHRDKLKGHLEQEGIGTQVHYPIPVHLQKAFSFLGYKKGDLPIAEKMAYESLSLPLWPGLTQEKVSRIANSIRRFFR
jgi:dTDP-4-amino-4,6-dideoxygalactose transaminase